MRVWRYEQDDINTDLLFPGKRCFLGSEESILKKYILEDLDEKFAKEVKPGDIIIANNNFGCGSSREHPVLGLKAVGIKAIIAKSFARIFYRCSINNGLIIIESPEAVDNYREGDEVYINEVSGILKIGDNTYDIPKMDKEILEIRDNGGLLEYTRKKLKARHIQNET